MTEMMSTTIRTEERLRCRSASKTDHPCWREATVDPDFDEEHPVYCPEHAHAICLEYEADERLIALEQMNDWIASSVNSETETMLQHHAYEMRERAEAEYWQAAVKAEAARRIAERGPDEEPLSPDQAEHLTALLLRARVLEEVRHALYYPEEAPRIHDRWHTVAGLAEASRVLSEEIEAYKREIGFK